MARHEATATRPRIGRPRKRPSRIDQEPREQILDAAAELFTSKGFGATTTREIASAAGFEQGSLFHYFERKNDILAELLDRTLDPALAFSACIDKQRAAPDEKLFLLAYRDTLNICSGPHNLASLMHLPEAKREEFSSYWEKRLKLKATYGRYIKAGLRKQLFDGIECELATELVFSMVESTIQWFVRGRHDAARTAQEVAVAALRLLLRDDSRLQAVVDHAAAWTVDGPCAEVMLSEAALQSSASIVRVRPG